MITTGELNSPSVIFIEVALLKRPRTFPSGSIYQERSAIS